MLVCLSAKIFFLLAVKLRITCDENVDIFVVRRGSHCYGRVESRLCQTPQSGVVLFCVSSKLCATEYNCQPGALVVNNRRLGQDFVSTKKRSDTTSNGATTYHVLILSDVIFADSVLLSRTLKASSA